MKLIHTLSIFAFALICLFGCKDSNDPEPDGKKNDPTQKDENIASTNIISKDISLRNFKGIVLEMDGDLILATGEDEDFGITIEGPDNVIDSIDVDLNKKNLIFSSDDVFTGDYKVKFYVSMPSVAYISIKGKSSVSNMKKSTTVGYDDELSIEIDGEALVDLELDAKYLDTNIGGVAEIYYSGALTIVHEIHNYGDLTYNGFGLNTKEIEIYTSRTSVTDCEILAGNQLTVEGSGSGTVRYKGSPEMFTDDLTGDIELIDLEK